MTSSLLECANILLVAIEFFIFFILASSFFQQQIPPVKNALCLILGFLKNYYPPHYFGELQCSFKISFLLFCIYSDHANYISTASHQLYYGGFAICFTNQCVRWGIPFGAAKLYHASQTDLISSPGNYYFLAYSAKIAELFLWQSFINGENPDSTIVCQPGATIYGLQYFP